MKTLVASLTCFALFLAMLLGKETGQSPFMEDRVCQVTLSDSEPAKEPDPTGKPKAKDSDFIGLKEKDAAALAKKRKLKSRVVSIDGESQLVTADYRGDRVNFSLEKGIVVKVDRG